MNYSFYFFVPRLYFKASLGAKSEKENNMLEMNKQSLTAAMGGLLLLGTMSSAMAEKTDQDQSLVNLSTDAAVAASVNLIIKTEAPTDPVRMCYGHPCKP